MRVRPVPLILGKEFADEAGGTESTFCRQARQRLREGARGKVRTPEALRLRGSVDQSGCWYWTIDHVVRIRAAKSALGALSSKIYLCRQGTKQHDGEK